jgi:hypothetical protein
VVAVRTKPQVGGVVALEVEAEAGRDVRPELARAVVGRGFDLLGLQEVGMSLEEIFLHLTTTEPAEEAAASAPAVGTEVPA